MRQLSPPRMRPDPLSPVLIQAQTSCDSPRSRNAAPLSLPGQKANVGIWSARDAVQLTEALQSLPIWPLITLEV